MTSTPVGGPVIRLTEPAPAPDPLQPIQRDVDALLERFIAERTDELVAMDVALYGIADGIADLARRGGKRLRPAFVYWGHRATGAEHLDGVLPVAGAVELLHTFALIHDDVMDRSTRRRGRPTLQVALAERDAAGGCADPDWFGVGGAVLAGDLAFVWADQLLDQAPLDAATLGRARTVFTTLRVEVMAGQYLDLKLAGAPDVDEPAAQRVALLKSGRYTVTRPLELGAALGASTPRLDRALRGYGDAIGLAFQLRDDVLGLFGDPYVTGKGALDDVREGKRTMLLLRALAMAPGAARDALQGIWGHPEIDEEDAARVRQIVVESGALAHIEAVVARKQAEACRHLEVLDQPARGALEELAALASQRTR